MASLYTKKGSPFIWIGGYDSSGKRFDESLRPLRAGKYKNAFEAAGRGDWGAAEKKKMKREAGILLEIEQPKQARTRGLKLSAAYDKFFDENTHFEESTANLYRNAIDSFAEFINKDLTVNKVTTQQIKSWKKHLEKNGYLKKSKKKANGDYTYIKKSYSRHTINNYITRLRVFFSFCIEQDWIKINPVISNKKLKLNTRKNVVFDIPSKTLGRIEEDLLAHDIWHYRFIHLIRLTGSRKSDIISLEWGKHVNFDSGTIRRQIIKTGELQELPMYEELYDFLREFRQEDGYVIPTIRNVASTRFWERSQARLGMKQTYTLTQIRKTTFTEMVIKGFDVGTIHLFTGHTNFQTTWDHYISVKKLIDAKKIDTLSIKNRQDKKEKEEKTNLKLLKF